MLLVLTGCRRSEVLALRWSDDREGRLFLRDSHTVLGPVSAPGAASPARAEPHADAVLGRAFARCAPLALEAHLELASRARAGEPPAEARHQPVPGVVSRFISWEHPTI